MLLFLLSHVWLFATPWRLACKAFLPFTISPNFLKLMSIEWWCHPTISIPVSPFSCSPHSFPASGSFPMSQLFPSGGQSIGALASVSVLPINIQGSFSLGLTDLISLVSQGALKRVFSSTTVWKHQFLSAQPSLWSNSNLYMTTGKTIALTIQTVISKVMSVFFNTLSRFVKALLPRSKCLLISWLHF